LTLIFGCSTSFLIAFGAVFALGLLAFFITIFYCSLVGSVGC